MGLSFGPYIFNTAFLIVLLAEYIPLIGIVYLEIYNHLDLVYCAQAYHSGYIKG